MTRNYTFKRLETDQELRDRAYKHPEYMKLTLVTKAYIEDSKDEALDHFVWGHLRMQRRIVDDYA